MDTISFSKASKILSKGSFYNPASLHYPKVANPQVACDYCRRDKLAVSVGYKKYDLCMQCVDRLSSNAKSWRSLPTAPNPATRNPLHVTLMRQDSVSPDCKTDMIQDSVRPNMWNATFMMQDSVRPSGSRYGENLTYMMQDSVRPYGSYSTFTEPTRMMQDSVRPKQHNLSGRTEGMVTRMMQDSVGGDRKMVPQRRLNIVGLSLDTAAQKYPELRFRVQIQDGQAFATTADYRTDRVNVELRNGIIVKNMGIN